jgi:hypothetical protein
MKRLSFAWILAVVLAILLPMTVFASWDIYYCSAEHDYDGNGSYDDPWSCTTDSEFDHVVDKICDYGGGILYEIVEDGYYRHTIEWDGKVCEVTDSVFYHGYPPDTGLTLPPPLIFGGAMALGIALLAGGVVLFRKRPAN